MNRHVGRGSNATSPLGPWVVDATQREAPQSVVEQLPVADPEAQKDSVDLVLRRRLQGRGWQDGARWARPLPLGPSFLPSLPHKASSRDRAGAASGPGKGIKVAMSSLNFPSISSEVIPPR